MHLTESQREKAFPIHLELGRSLNETVSPAPEKPKKGKGKKYYPTLFIDSVAGLEQLPEEGCILIDYKRRSMTVSQRDGKATCSVELEIRTLCLPDEYEDTNDAEELVDELAKKAYRQHEDAEDDGDEDNA